MYQMDARVRYSEVDETHRIKLESVLDYFQDCCTFHSEDVGGGLEFLKGQKRAWLLASWQIVIKEYPKLGEQIRIIANPYAFKNFFGHRNLMLQDEHGKDLVYANSNWIFVNTETGKPVRIPDEVANAYELGEPYPMEYAARKISMPKHLEAKEPFAVHRFCIDSNHHVNNGKYVLMAEEFLPEQFLVSELRVEYRKAAVDAVRKLSVDVGIPTKLEALKEEDLSFLAESAHADACAPGNPKDASVEDLKNLFRKLM